jgi:hypothetical protein
VVLITLAEGALAEAVSQGGQHFLAVENQRSDPEKKSGRRWVFAGGLAAPSSATVIDNRGEEAMFSDGPFLESKEPRPPT